MKKQIRFVLLLLALLGSRLPTAIAQPPATHAGAIDVSFNPLDTGLGDNVGTDSAVYATAVQPDGKMLAGGSFTHANGLPANFLVRFNSDGTTDLSFNTGTGPDNYVQDIQLQPDGKILVAGSMQHYNGTPVSHVFRLNADGSLDLSFMQPAVADPGIVNDILLLPDGKMMAGGYFTSYQGQTAACLLRLNADGTVDNSFVSGSGLAGDVFSIARQSTGHLIVGGNFNSYDGHSSPRLARLEADGTWDPTFTANIGSGVTGFASYVDVVAVDAADKVWVGGRFQSFNSVPIFNLVLLSPDGILESGIDIFSGAIGLDGDVRHITVLSNGKVMVAGTFPTGATVPNPHLLRLTTAYAIDPAFVPESSGPDGPVRSLSEINPDNYFIGGDFEHYDAFPRRHVAVITKEGFINLNAYRVMGADGDVYTSLVQPDGKIVIGGNFRTYNGSLHRLIARLNPDGSEDASFTAQIMGANDYVNHLLLQPDGKILACGYFETANGFAYRSICRLNPDGSTDLGFTQGSGPGNSPILKMLLQPDGKIVLGGHFVQYDGIARGRLARLNPDGSLDFNFNPFANAVVNALERLPDGSLFAAGNFTTINGIPLNRVAKLSGINGTPDMTFIAPPFNDMVTGLYLPADGNMWVCGYFTASPGVPKRSLVRLDPYGAIHPTFNNGIGDTDLVYRILPEPDGRLILAGILTTYDGRPVNDLVRIFADGRLDSTFHSGNGAVAPDESAPYSMFTIRTLCRLPDGKIFAGGSFNEYYSTHRNRVCRILNPACIYPEAPFTYVTSTPACPGQSVGLIISFGNLNDAVDWEWYEGDCAGTLVGTGPFLGITAPALSTTYYVRGVGGCVIHAPCTPVNLSVLPLLGWFKDEDGDGHGNADSLLLDCYEPFGYVADNTDCDDANPNAYPGALELCNNGIDENCNGMADDVCLCPGDVTPPSFSGCPANIYITAAVGATTAPASWTPPTATDECGIASFFFTHNPGDDFPLGATLVTYTASDPNSNIATCTFYVIVCPAADFTVDDINVACPQFTATLNAVTAATGATYQWYKNGVLVTGATNPAYNIALKGNYHVQVSWSACVNVSPVKYVMHTTPTLTVNGYVYKCTGDDYTIYVSPGSLGSSYQWLRTSAPTGPVGTNDPQLTTSIPGNYVCDITYAGGCTKRAGTVKLRDVPWACPAKTDEEATTHSLMAETESGLLMQAYPVPASDELHVLVENAAEYTLSLMDMNGRMLESIPSAADNRLHTIHTAPLASGLYLLLLRSGNELLKQKVVIAR